MMTMFVMTLGEMNYHDNFLPWDKLAFATLTNILFIVLVLGMPIIMMNMLVRKRTVHNYRILIKSSIDFFNASFSFKQRLSFQYPEFFVGEFHIKLKMRNNKMQKESISENCNYSPVVVFYGNWQGNRYLHVPHNIVTPLNSYRGLNGLCKSTLWRFKAWVRSPNQNLINLKTFVFRIY